jgi:hypothetical protein
LAHSLPLFGRAVHEFAPECLALLRRHPLKTLAQFLATLWRQITKSSLGVAQSLALLRREILETFEAFAPVDPGPVRAIGPFLTAVCFAVPDSSDNARRSKRLTIAGRKLVFGPIIGF